MIYSGIKALVKGQHLVKLVLAIQYLTHTIVAYLIHQQMPLLLISLKYDGMVLIIWRFLKCLIGKSGMCSKLHSMR
jgi:hypothetical protein